MATIAIPIDIDSNAERGEQFVRVLDADGNTVTSFLGYGTAAKAKSGLRTKLIDLVRLAESVGRNDRSELIRCADGTCILVAWCPASRGWIYRTTRAGQSYPSSALGDWPGFDDCYRAAAEHANGSYGGIVESLRF